MRRWPEEVVFSLPIVWALLTDPTLKTVHFSWKALLLCCDGFVGIVYILPSRQDILLSYLPLIWVFNICSEICFLCIFFNYPKTWKRSNLMCLMLEISTEFQKVIQIQMGWAAFCTCPSLSIDYIGKESNYSLTQTLQRGLHSCCFDQLSLTA